MIFMKTSNQPLSKASYETTRSLLVQSVSLMSLLGLLSASAAIAQTAEPSSEPNAIEVVPEPAAVKSAPRLSNQEVYIDPTDYNIGATRRDTAPRFNPEAPGRFANSPQFSGRSRNSLPESLRLRRTSSGQNWATYGPGQTTAAGRRVTASINNKPITTGRNYYVTRDFQYRTYRPPSRLGNDNVRLLFPLTIPAPITSLFGWRIHPITGESRFHAGVDLGAPLGTPVIAALAGRVAIADWLGGYGMLVAVQHGEQGQQQTLYAHLSEIFVKPGEPVQQGDVIGRVGSTGASTGPHLHFEFRQQTPDGWVALDAGAQLEYGLAELVKSMQVAKKTSAAE